ncbi:alkane 1-monooxygenase [Nevskia soli]|uniref:alkane 1-monooxygenase n=1 Tax=Nevskia soli TaxID=418856 RepID=UPI0004A6F8AA|nr:alkane 1-monooxygenase [Nevskia soli]
MTTATLSAPAWTDKKRYLWLLGIVVMGLPLYGYGLYLWTGLSLFFWTTPVIVYTLIPLFDRLIGEDESNPPDGVMAALAQEKYYRYVVYAAIPAQYLSFIGGTYLAVRGDLVWYQWLGLLVSVGMTSGLAINVGHELGHQTSKLERWLAKIALAPVMYGHFYVEHNRGHHVRVATPEDPATSRFGESFYEFLPRCVYGSIKSAWEIEKQRLEKQGKSVWSIENDNLQAWAITVALFAAMTAWLGWWALPFMIVQGAYGGSLLEVVNYLEHYGLRRQKKADGSYERCQPHHSWNSNHTATNIFLYHLQRHSDHHANPTRSFQTLRNFEGVPRLPNGYAGMIVVAYIPWLWFRVMDPKVVQHFGGDMSKANIKPSIRDRILAKYGSATA